MTNNVRNPQHNQKGNKMAFQIQITELIGEPGKPADEIKRYEQTVEALDLRRVIDAINYKPRVYKPRAKKGGEQP